MNHSASRTPTRSQRRSAAAFYDPRQGNGPFQIQPVSFPAAPFELPRTNCFSIFLIETGTGTFWADTAQHPFTADQLLFFVPYQFRRFDSASPVTGTQIEFHANFLCVETFHAETGCNGTLFNDPYGAPLVTLNRQAKTDVRHLVRRILKEQDQSQTASEEAIAACMKLLLITAARLKPTDEGVAAEPSTDYRQPVLLQLRELIEQNYHVLHSPAEYAALMHMTPKTLGKHVRDALGKTLTNLIRERILTHAKWELLHTLKPVKEVAGELGFRDELYFSRMFKQATGISPTYFREFETEIRNGSNLSMSFS